MSLDTGSGDRWWEQVDLRKLILASNQIKELSSEIRNLPALNVLDVCGSLCFLICYKMESLKYFICYHLLHTGLAMIGIGVLRPALLMG